jgi:hypothetical protein
MRSSLLAALVLVATACSGSEPPSTEADLIPTGQREHAMRHCPSAVPGAITTIETSPGSVDLVITAGEADPAREIVSRSRAAERLGRPVGPVLHDGSHSGPGTIGHCPLIRVDTTIIVDDVPGGVRVRIRPTDPNKLDDLRAAVKARVDALVFASS